MSNFGNYSDYLVPPMAASLAIVPVFYGLQAKTAQQLGRPFPSTTVGGAFRSGLRAAPTVGGIVGTQMVVQNVIEKTWMDRSEKPTLSSMVASSLVVGAVSAPALAIFNGQTAEKGVIESLKNLSLKQGGAILVRETCFLSSLKVSEAVSHTMKRMYGDNKLVEYSSAFVSAGVVSALGHPADTALTLWQNKMKVVRFSQLGRGAPVRALTMGGFTAGYKLIKEIFDSWKN